MSADNGTFLRFIMDHDVMTTAAPPEVASNVTRLHLRSLSTSHIRYITLTFYLATFLFGLVGNALVIYVIARFKKIRRKSVANYYIFNLAVADQLFIVTIPWFCAATYTSGWMFGDVMCRVTTVIRECNKFASIFTLVALTIDRYLATYHNLGCFRTIRVGKGVCLAIWACCLLCSTPYWMYAQQVAGRNGKHSCQITWPAESRITVRRVWTYMQLVLGYLLPLVVIVTFNLLLLFRLRGMVRPGNEGKIAKRMRKRNNASMTKTVMTVVIIFLVCQAPYYVMEITSLRILERSVFYSLTPSLTETLVFVHINMLAQILVFVSSSCNPLIYGLYNKNYRILYRQVLCCGYFTESKIKKRHSYKMVAQRDRRHKRVTTLIAESAHDMVSSSNGLDGPEDLSSGRTSLKDSLNSI